MATRRDIVEAILFLPAMALLAAVLFALLYLVILAGGWILRGWFWLLASIGLPHSLALALAVILGAFTVYGGFQLLELGRRRHRGKAGLKA